MDFIENIKKPIHNELQEFNAIYSTVLDSDNKLLEDVHNYVLEGSGKKLRPILTLLAAKLLGEVNESSRFAALSVELLHTASLVHDDVVDDTPERRGRDSVNARWTNKVAVLTGDYLLSKSLHSAYLTKDIHIVGAIANIGMTLTDGELLQLSVLTPATIDESLYLSIVERKTAQLFATCMEVGARSVGATEEQIALLKEYGNALGVCFQIKDDIFDYDEHAKIGKPTGNDVRDGKLTLPLIYALRSCQTNEKDEIIRLISEKDFAPANILRIMNFALDNGGLEYAKKSMREYSQKAIGAIKSFADSQAKQALIDCISFVSDRSF